MSLLFSKDEILLVNRKLAALIGLNEAIVLQQIHYWIKKKGGGVEHAGSRWTAAACRCSLLASGMSAPSCDGCVRTPSYDRRRAGLTVQTTPHFFQE